MKKALILTENITPFILYLSLSISILFFLAILFILMLTPFRNTDLCRLWFPLASEAIEDFKPDPRQLVINVYHEPSGICNELQYDMHGQLINPCSDISHWKIIIKGKVISLGDLEKEIRLEGDMDRSSSDTFSNRVILIRADAGAPWKIVKQILSACKKAKVWKIEFGAERPFKSNALK